MTQSPIIFDRGQNRRAKARSSCNADNGNFLADWNLGLLCERLDDIKRHYPKALLIGHHHSSKTLNRLKDSGKIDDLVIASTLPDSFTTIVIDDESLSFPAHSFDLVLCPFTLHRINDVPGFLTQIKIALKPDGLFLGGFPGESTLMELRQSFMQTEMDMTGGVHMRVHPCIDKQQAAALMQRAGYALPVVDAEKITVIYDHAFALMKDLRGLGETNSLIARPKTLTRKSLMMAMADYYQTHFKEEDGRIYATFEMLFLSGWSPHESQQQPLRPGSAQSRLAAALGTEEIGAGEVARS